MLAKTARSAAPPTSAWRILAARHTAEDVNRPFCSHDPKFLHISQRNDCYRRQYYIGDRRKRARLSAFYKFHTGSLINTRSRSMLAKHTRSTRQTHPATYRVPSCRTEYRQQSFFLRTIQDWNCLPAEVILSPTLDSFKDKILTLPLPSH
ncbi:hypothetical protein Bbelb_381970 [Branchiostoma belcheri]|nr:hypothetical protein Bbelb_381970 [Branchiostoma belcheri]